MIEYKIVERADPRNRSKKKFYPSINITGETTIKELCAEIEEISTVSSVDVGAVLEALSKVLPRHLLDGKSIGLDGIGHFRLGAKTEGSDNAEDVSSHNIKETRIVYYPDVELKANTQKAKFRKIS